MALVGFIKTNGGKVFELEVVADRFNRLFVVFWLCRLGLTDQLRVIDWFKSIHWIGLITMLFSNIRFNYCFLSQLQLTIHKRCIIDPYLTGDYLLGTNHVNNICIECTIVKDKYEICKRQVFEPSVVVRHVLKSQTNVLVDLMSTRM